MRTLSVLLALAASSALAHDTWVQTNTNLIRTGDAVHIDLMLGNHGNEHRDFKLASKADPSAGTLDVIGPDGRKYDIRDRLNDLGYAPKEGFHSAKFATAQPGLYTVSHTLEQIVNHGKPVRSVRSGKTFFLVSKSLDKVTPPSKAALKPLGHALELVPVVNTVAPAGPEIPIEVVLMFQGKPLRDTKVSFIPRGTTLKEGTDSEYERVTDADGKASFTPREGNYYLIAAHLKKPSDGAAEYHTISYSATLTVFVPETCPCCE